jgi:hypothetical protein
MSSGGGIYCDYRVAVNVPLGSIEVESGNVELRWLLRSCETHICTVLVCGPDEETLQGRVHYTIKSNGVTCHRGYFERRKPNYVSAGAVAAVSAGCVGQGIKMIKDNYRCPAGACLVAVGLMLSGLIGSCHHRSKWKHVQMAGRRT